MTKRIILLVSLIFLFNGCTKTVCYTDRDCYKKLDWNNKGFTLARTILTQGANAGK